MARPCTRTRSLDDYRPERLNTRPKPQTDVATLAWLQDNQSTILPSAFDNKPRRTVKKSNHRQWGEYQ